jgi:predicted PurR-regulated permease PerM
MLLLTRLIELLSVNRRLKTSRPYVLSALTGFAVLALLGVFGTILCALVVSGLLWVSFDQLQAAGLGVGVSALITCGVAVLVLLLVALSAAQVWRGVRSDIGRVIDGQAPLIAPVIDKTGDLLGGVANAFASGLKRRAGKG